MYLCCFREKLAQSDFRFRRVQLGRPLWSSRPLLLNEAASLRGNGVLFLLLSKSLDEICWPQKLVDSELNEAGFKKVSSVVVDSSAVECSKASKGGLFMPSGPKILVQSNFFFSFFFFFCCRLSFRLCSFLCLRLSCFCCFLSLRLRARARFSAFLFFAAELLCLF